MKRKAKMKFITTLLISAFILNAFAQENPMPEEPQQVDNPEQILPPEQPACPGPQLTRTPEKRTESIKNEPVVKGDQSKIYLDFRDTDMKEVARIFSKISGVSILVSENVKSKVTLNIEGVPWEKALELILKTYGLASIKKDNFIIIVTYKEVQEEQDQVPLTTKIITLNFANPDDTKTYVKAIQTKRGTMESDKKTNSLVITDTPEAIERIEKIISQLDKKTPQVLIEVWMIDKSLLNDWDFGIDWQVQDKSSPQWDPAADPAGTPPINSKYTYPASVTQSIASSSANDLVINYGKSLMNYLRLGGTLRVLQEDTNTKVLANPRILTLDNVSAEITITDQIPYTNVSDSTQSANTITSTQFKDATTKLTVKPHITPDNNVIMEIATEQGFKSGEVIDVNGTQPIIATRKSTNTMIIKNQETVVLGGLRARTSSKLKKKIPLLGDIPGIGKLFFQSTSDSDTIRELIIFVTPIIVRDESLKMEEREEGSLKETMELLPPKTNKSKESILKKLDPQVTPKERTTLFGWFNKPSQKPEAKKESASSSTQAVLKMNIPPEETKKLAPKTNINIPLVPQKSEPKLDKKIPDKTIKEEIVPDFKHLKLLPLKTPNEVL
ncbi:MAG: secretin N-terminal domain-containing protein [Candidatus Omnitrophota bacterium]|jgi:type IV pilus assembly protein PilQ